MKPKATYITIDVFSDEYYKLKEVGIIKTSPELEEALASVNTSFKQFMIRVDTRKDCYKVFDEFYDIESVEEFSACTVNLIDSFKYLTNCVILGTDEEFAEKLTPELLEAFEGVKGDFNDFIKAFNYYSVSLELFQKAKAEGKEAEVRENFNDFTKQVIAELKKRNL